VNRLDIIEAYYAFFTDYHSGQWSREYQRLCKIGTYFTPGAGWQGFESLSEDGKNIYNRLEGHYETE